MYFNPMLKHGVKLKKVETALAIKLRSKKIWLNNFKLILVKLKFNKEIVEKKDFKPI